MTVYQFAHHTGLHDEGEEWWELTENGQRVTDFDAWTAEQAADKAMSFARGVGEQPFQPVVVDGVWTMTTSGSHEAPATPVEAVAWQLYRDERRIYHVETRATDKEILREYLDIQYGGQIRRNYVERATRYLGLASTFNGQAEKAVAEAKGATPSERRISAVRNYRIATGCGLKTAIDVVDPLLAEATS